MKKAMDSFPQFETPTHLVRRESKCVKHQPMFTLEVALRMQRSVCEGFDFELFFFADKCKPYINSLFQPQKNVSSFNNFVAAARPIRSLCRVAASRKNVA